MNIIKGLIKRPISIIMATLAILAFGVVACLNMPVNIVPEMALPMLGVTVVYPGANAETVAEDVTDILEDNLKTVNGVESITTYSMDNVSTVVIEFDYGVNLDKKVAAIQEKLDILPLPQNADEPKITRVDFNATPVVTVAVYRENEDFTSLKKSANSLKSQFESLDGVGSVTLKGAPSSRIDITPSDKIKVNEFLSISLSELGLDIGLEQFTLLFVQALSDGSLDIPLGTIMDNGNIVSIRNAGEAASIADLKGLPVKLPDSFTAMIEPMNKMLHIKYPILPESTHITDLMPTLKSGYLSLDSMADISKNTYYDSLSSVNGKSSITLEISKIADANSSKIVKQVKEKLTAFSDDGVTAKLLDDQAKFIDESIQNVLSSILIGGILAILIIFLFLRNVRSSLIIAITMPLSVMAALICLFLLGVSINMVSLGGLAVGIGMLVDNSIVVIESISNRRDRGENAYMSALYGAKNVASSILASTLTTICVFFPIMFMQGLTREIFTDLSLSVIFSLSFSFIVAVTVIPCLYCLVNGGKKYFLRGSNMFKSKDSPSSSIDSICEKSEIAESPIPYGGINSNLSVDTASLVLADKTSENADGTKEKIKRKNTNSKGKIMMKIESGYEKILPKVLGKRLVVCLVALVLFSASVLLVFTTGMEFLPSIDKGLIEVNIALAPNAQLAEAEEKTNQMKKLIEDNVKNIDTLSTAVGKQGMIATSLSGYIKLQLKIDSTAKTVEQIRNLATSIEGASITVSPVDGVVAMITSGMGGMSVSIVGENIKDLENISKQIREKLAKVEGLRDITDNLSQKSTEYKIKVDKAKCIQKGVDYSSLVQTLRVGLAGMTISNSSIDGEKLDINVHFSENTIDSLEKLENFVVGFALDSSDPNTPVFVTTKLSDVAAITVDKNKTAVITKLNGKPVLEISAQTYGIDTGSASKKFSKACDEVLVNFEGYTYQASGVQSYLSSAFSGLFIALFISLFLLFAIMAAQFESLIKPFIVMFSIPFSFTGGFLALLITGTSLNVVSFIGIIMLVGVIVNNAIIMIDKITELCKTMPAFDAVVAGAKSRLRPILMTTLTTVLALIPLSLGLGSGGELMQPMAIVVIGGLILGTLVTLLLIPTIYCLFKRIRKAPSAIAIKNEPLENTEKTNAN